VDFKGFLLPSGLPYAAAGRLRARLEGCGFTLWPDLMASKGGETNGKGKHADKDDDMVVRRPRFIPATFGRRGSGLRRTAEFGGSTALALTWAVAVTD
jgi:hypothetical protein